jgi:hypothetical protein
MDKLQIVMRSKLLFRHSPELTGRLVEEDPIALCIVANDDLTDQLCDRAVLPSATFEFLLRVKEFEGHLYCLEQHELPRGFDHVTVANYALHRLNDLSPGVTGEKNDGDPVAITFESRSFGKRDDHIVLYEQYLFCI